MPPVGGKATLLVNAAKRRPEPRYRWPDDSTTWEAHAVELESIDLSAEAWRSKGGWPRNRPDGMESAARYGTSFDLLTPCAKAGERIIAAFFAMLVDRSAQ